LPKLPIPWVRSAKFDQPRGKAAVAATTRIDVTQADKKSNKTMQLGDAWGSYLENARDVTYGLVA
jgi:hypothetical protein